MAKTNARRKPPPDLVKKAAAALSHPEKASKKTIQRLAAEVLDNQQFDSKPPTPKPKPAPTRKKKT
jgi:hypothetical protein